MLLVTIPVAPIITGIIVHFRFHIRCISIHKLLYFNFFSASFCTTFLSAGIATSMSVYVSLFCFNYYIRPIRSNFSVFINIIIIIIIIIIISFMQGTYTPETNYVPREHGVAAILLLLFMVLISLLAVLNQLYFYISTFRSMCAVPNMAVFCSCSAQYGCFL